MKTENTKIIKISKLPLGKEISFLITEKDIWPSEIFAEIADDTHLLEFNLNFSLTKFRNDQLHDHVIIDGKLNAKYETPCSRCLEPANESINLNFKLCVIPCDLREDPKFNENDNDVILYKNEELDLHFYSQNQIDIYEIIHESIFLNLNFTPLHDENCKGLCHTCGANLNIEKCPHNP